MASRPARQALLLLFLMTVIAACQGWRTLDPPFQQAVADRAPDRIRLLLTDSTRIEMLKPVVEADSLIGRGRRDERVAVPSAQIVAAEQRMSDVASTAALLLLAGGLVGWLVWGYCCTGT